MPIPNKPLEISLDFLTLTLDEAALFDLESLQELNTDPMAAFAYLNLLRKFLKKHITSWTATEIGSIAITDLPVFLPVLVEAMKATAIPLASSTPSKTGPAEKKMRSSQAGHRKSSTAKSSTSSPKMSAES